MPIDVSCKVDSEISLAEFVDSVIPLSDKLGDEDVLKSFAPQITRLAQNRTFLADLLVEYLLQLPINMHLI